MKKSTKGALAAGTAAVLLMGGAGSLAYWTDHATVNGTNIATGSMALGDPSCGNGWTWPNGTAVGSSTLLVPGDTVETACTMTLTGAGDHLSATLSLDAASGGLSDTATSSTLTQDLKATFTYDPSGDDDGGVDTSGDDVKLANGATITKFTSTGKVYASVTYTLPYGDSTTQNADDTQNLSGALNAINFSLQQD